MFQINGVLFLFFEIFIEIELLKLKQFIRFLLNFKKTYGSI